MTVGSFGFSDGFAFIRRNCVLTHHVEIFSVRWSEEMFTCLDINYFNFVDIVVQAPSFLGDKFHFRFNIICTTFMLLGPFFSRS